MRRFVSILLWLSAAACFAQDAGSLSLTLKDASLRALSRNTSLLVERESLTQADLAIDSAEGAYDLFWNADARYRDRTDPVNSTFSGAPEGDLAPTFKGVTVGTSFTQLIPTGGTAEAFTNWGRDTTNSVFTILSPAYRPGSASRCDSRFCGVS